MRSRWAGGRLRSARKASLRCAPRPPSGGDRLGGRHDCCGDRRNCRGTSPIQRLIGHVILSPADRVRLLRGGNTPTHFSSKSGSHFGKGDSRRQDLILGIDRLRLDRPRAGPAAASWVWVFDLAHDVVRLDGIAIVEADAIETTKGTQLISARGHRPFPLRLISKKQWCR